MNDIVEGGTIDDSSMRDLLRISKKLSVLDVALTYSKKNWYVCQKNYELIKVFIKFFRILFLMSRMWGKCAVYLSYLLTYLSYYMLSVFCNGAEICNCCNVVVLQFAVSEL